MRESNFFAFCVVSGFFIGLFLAILSGKGVIQITEIVAFCTLFFYLGSHISIALFLRFTKFSGVRFDKEFFERKLDYFYNQLQQRESEVDANYAFMSVNGSGKKSDKKSR